MFLVLIIVPIKVVTPGSFNTVTHGIMDNGLMALWRMMSNQLKLDLPIDEKTSILSQYNTFTSYTHFIQSHMN